MKVLHLHFGLEGGAERFFVTLAQALAERGLEQRFIIRPDRVWGNEIRAIGPTIEDHGRRLTLAGNLLQLRVRWLCARWKPDVILAWKPRGARYVPNVRGAIKITRFGDFPKHLRHYRHMDLLVGNLPGIADRIRKLGWTGPMLTISNFPKPVVPRPVKRADFTTPDDAFLIATGGRFVRRKGLDTAVRAAAAVPGAWLWLIGEGEERAALESLAREVGIHDRTRFIGWQDEPAHFVAAADAFVMPSRHEPLGNFLLEAWQLGVPSVTTATEGPRWFMRDGVDGLMVPIDDWQGMAQAFEVIRTDPARRAAFVANARERLDQMFSRDGIVDAYLRIFRGDFTDPSASA
jgi:glycosyltransferase involved in cell wall biosynthesis